MRRSHWRPRPSCLGGCVNVHSTSIRGTGYVRLDEVVKHHPLYPQLSQLDDAIAAINLAAAAPHVPLSASQIAQQTTDLNRAAARRAEPRQRDSRAKAAAVRRPRTPGRRRGVERGRHQRRGAYAAGQMSATSAQQARQAAAAANQDFMAYQQSVVAQNNAATSAIARQLQQQASQKYSAKAAQLQQNETDLSLRLSQADAAQRLAIKTRLSNLALDEATRKQLQGQLESINSKESSQLDAARRADAATLSAYRAQLSAQTGAAVRTQAGAIAGQTQAKLLERRNEVGAQLRSLGPPALPPNLPPGVRDKLAAIHQPVHRAISGRCPEDGCGLSGDEGRSGPAVCRPSRRRRGRDRSCGQRTRSFTAAARCPLQADRRPGNARSGAHCERARIQYRASIALRPPPAVTTSPTISSRTSKAYTSETSDIRLYAGRARRVPFADRLRNERARSDWSTCSASSPIGRSTKTTRTSCSPTSGPSQAGAAIARKKCALRWPCSKSTQKSPNSSRSRFATRRPRLPSRESCKLVVTREGIGYGGVDITGDVEKSLNITEKATPTPSG